MNLRAKALTGLAALSGAVASIALFANNIKTIADLKSVFIKAEKPTTLSLGDVRAGLILDAETWVENKRQKRPVQNEGLRRGWYYKGW